MGPERVHKPANTARSDEHASSSTKRSSSPDEGRHQRPSEAISSHQKQSEVIVHKALELACSCELLLNLLGAGKLVLDARAFNGMGAFK